jgi:hypothetical protein
MAKIPIREVPSSLPNARLYLDDLLQIEEIITGLRPEVQVVFSYEVDGADIFTSIQDLRDHGGYSALFEMKIREESWGDKYSLTVLRFDPHHLPRMSVVSMPSEHAWPLHGQLQQLFNRRRLFGKGTMTRYSALGISFWGTVLATAAVAYQKTHLWESQLIGPLLTVLSVVILVGGGYVWFATSGVYFKDERATQKQRTESRIKIAGQIGLVLFGAILKTVLDHLWAATKH